jgi:hypothetical protein
MVPVGPTLTCAPGTTHSLHMPMLLQGVAINFVKNDDIKILRDIEQFYSTQM